MKELSKMNKNTYYVNVSAGEIYRDKTVDEWEYEIQATENEIAGLRSLFDRANSISNDSFGRSLLPFVPYHKDTVNDQYDDTLSSIYQMIHDLGDDDAKEHIESMGIL
jgi:hypothetical protein